MIFRNALLPVAVVLIASTGAQAEDGVHQDFDRLYGNNQRRPSGEWLMASKVRAQRAVSQS